jgi:hypothetical protein
MCATSRRRHEHRSLPAAHALQVLKQPAQRVQPAQLWPPVVQQMQMALGQQRQHQLQQALTVKQQACAQMVPQRQRQRRALQALCVVHRRQRAQVQRASQQQQQAQQEPVAPQQQEQQQQ